MKLSAAICERARQSRDARFDGRFFIAVVTTRVFCRPTCPVQPPLAKNVRFYSTAAAALAAGFRPCLRCLPELAPGNRMATSGPALVRHALKRIDDGYLDDGTVADLAAELQVTPRHLTRLFEQHVGASPHRVAHTRRLLFAKHLLDESTLSIAEIAYASGFGSLRRFNSVVKATWQRTPGALRRHRAVAGGHESIRLRLGYRPPFDWAGLLDFFAGRAIPGVESVADGCYRRSFRLDGQVGGFSVAPAGGDGHALELHARIPDIRLLPELVTRVRRMFDLDADLLAVASVLGRDPLLSPVMKRHAGIRVPGAWDPFEIAVRAILGQQISVAAARTLASRLVAEFGEALDDAPAQEPDRLFPVPACLADARLESLGVVGTRAEAIRRLAQEVADGRIDFSRPDVASRLVALPGIGDWTAQYIGMRSGHDPDAFPAADLGLLRGAEEGERMTPARLRRRAEDWRPWRAYAAICLWRRYTAMTSGGN
ncbi:AraC family transcriptional regulator of adaptative response / DNA-3-methyladenine glycosylase II [Natronospira proteinivora]|uniref:DNA-3-methyladenine glycosylase II n=1 Tax=Natronospira proteinivora TaxID=1807133 RepID=A0ABT1G7F8_9GAMM|nr:DNA-3-methyladenine glycosylase 2 [Natronospira proteinivora]MCP1727244.1 AraC family transcriptional regulator of adaptative response / DNA-3-methyladenine glycosylase II [Natronospira proteinivora]